MARTRRRRPRPAPRTKLPRTRFPVRDEPYRFVYVCGVVDTLRLDSVSAVNAAMDHAEGHYGRDSQPVRLLEVLKRALAAEAEAATTTTPDNNNPK